MKMKAILDSVEQQIPILKIRRVDRFMLLEWANQELKVLASHIGDSGLLARQLDPVIYTETGKQKYQLPEDFGENFLRVDDTETRQFACLLDDGTNEAQLNYLGPAEFHVKHKQGESNGRPSDYTILTSYTGERELLIGPPPNSNSDSQYTIAGSYVPREWNLEEEENVPPFPNSFGVLKYALLRTLAPANQVFQAEYERNRAMMIVRCAPSVSQVAPDMFGTVGVFGGSR